MRRIIIFTGKGGVGKTSTAAAHALKAAREGMKTLIDTILLFPYFVECCRYLKILP